MLSAFAGPPPCGSAGRSDRLPASTARRRTGARRNTHLIGATVWDQVRRGPRGTDPAALLAEQLRIHGRAIAYGVAGPCLAIDEIAGILGWRNKPITQAPRHRLGCHDESVDADEVPRLVRVRKVIAGVAIALGLSLLLMALVLATGGVIAGGPAGMGSSLALAMTIALLATPLLLLGRAVWRRAGPPSAG